MTESEQTTRKKRVDEKLKSSLSNWIIIHNSKVDDTAVLHFHAVEEYPTATGPADYALFVGGLGFLCTIHINSNKERYKVGNLPMNYDNQSFHMPK